MRRVLVTAISGDIANGLLKILRESEQAFIVGCDVTEYPVGMDKVDVFRRSALAVSEGYPDEMLALCQEFGITHMIPANEREIAVISPIRSNTRRCVVYLRQDLTYRTALCAEIGF